MKAILPSVRTKSSTEGATPLPSPSDEREKSNRESSQDGLITDANIETGTTSRANDKFHKLGWKRFASNITVETIAIGSLSIASAFAVLGMALSIFLSVTLGILAIFTSWIIGQVALKHGSTMRHYTDPVRLLCGRRMAQVVLWMMVAYFVMIAGSHNLTGTITWYQITEQPICAIVPSLISMAILWLFALPSTLDKFSWLGYIDLASLVSVLVIVMAVGGLELPIGARPWSVGVPPETTVAQGLLACTNILFAYSIALPQLTFMSEMHTPEDYKKAIFVVGVVEILFYTVTGAIVYFRVGADVRNLALLSVGKAWLVIVFVVALPVIFISGSVNLIPCGRLLLDAYASDGDVKKVNGRKGKWCWAALMAGLSIAAFVVAQLVPLFQSLLGIICALFITTFSFLFPPFFWFKLVMEGRWNANASNMLISGTCVLVFLVGIVIMFGGLFGSISEIIEQVKQGNAGLPFSCSARGYQ